MKINSYIKSLIVLGLISSIPKFAVSFNSCYIKGLGGTQPSKLCELRDFLKKLAPQKRKKNNPQSERPASMENVILLHGPIGTGKTDIAHKMAQEAGAKILYYDGSDLAQARDNKTPEEAVTGVKQIYLNAEKIAQNQPVVIIIDDLDGYNESTNCLYDFNRICQLRTLKAMWKKHVNNPYITTIIITNSKTWEKIADHTTPVELPMPNEKQRYEIIKFYLANTKHHLSDEFLQKLAAKTKDFAGRDLEIILSYAKMLSNYEEEEGTGFVEEVHLTEAYEKMRKKIDMLKR